MTPLLNLISSHTGKAQLSGIAMVEHAVHVR